MSKILKALVICAIIVVVTALLSVLIMFWAIRSEWFWENHLTRYWNQNNPVYQVQSLDIGRHHLAWPLVLTLENTRLTLLSHQKKYDIYLGRAVNVLSSKMSDPVKEFDFRFENSSITAKDIEFRNMDGHFEGAIENSDPKMLQGSLRIKEGHFKKVYFSNVFVPIQLTDNKYISRGFSFEAYKGSGQGDIFVDKISDIPYSMTINLKGVELNRLTDIHSAVFSQWHGRVDGTIEIAGSRTGVKKFRTSLDAPKGGMVKAKVLKTVIQQIPESTRQRRDLDYLLKENAFLPLQIAQGELFLENAQQLKGKIRIYNKDYLDVTYPIQIRITGGFLNVLKKLEAFSGVL